MKITRRPALMQLFVVTASGLLSCLIIPFIGQAQDTQPDRGRIEPAVTIVIPDEPKTIDPATFYPEKITKKVTVEFENQTLKEIGDWLKNQQSISVRFDARGMSEAGLSVDQPITDRLDDAPIYFLLDRLKQHYLTWYDDDGTLIITSIETSNETLSSQCYNVRDLVNQGYPPQDFAKLIEDFVSGPWVEREHPRKVTLLGDVLIARQSYQIQCEIAGLLAALRKHGQ